MLRERSFHLHLVSIAVSDPSLSFLFGSFSGEVLAGELDDVGRVVADDLLGEVLEDLWELLRHHDLLSRENSHFPNVCHLRYAVSNLNQL